MRALTRLHCSEVGNSLGGKPQHSVVHIIEFSLLIDRLGYWILSSFVNKTEGKRRELQVETLYKAKEGVQLEISIDNNVHRCDLTVFVA